MRVINFNPEGTELDESKDNIALALSKKDLSKENLIKIRDYISRYKNGNTKRIQFLIEDDLRSKSSAASPAYIYSAEQFNMLESFDKYLKSINQPGVLFAELVGASRTYNDFKHEIVKRENFKDCWNIEQVKKANAEIDAIVDQIKDRNLSPFEAMLYIHKYASTLTYNEGTLKLEESRSITGIFNRNAIVCGGYATLVHAIVDKLHIPGLRAETVGCVTVSSADGKRSVCGHSHNLIHIDDHKYNIRGHYAEDSVPADDDVFELSTCLYPICDLEEINGKYIQDPGDTAFIAVMQGSSTLSNMAQYGRLEILPTAKIIQNYVNKSTPITLDKYVEALKNLGVENYEEIIATSKEAAEQYYQGHPKNCFATDANKR